MSYSSAHQLSSPKPLQDGKGVSSATTPMTTTPTTPISATTLSRTATPLNQSQSAFSQVTVASTQAPSSLNQSPFGLHPCQPIQPSFLPDFGLSALSSLTQIAKLQTGKLDPRLATSSTPGALFPGSVSNPPTHTDQLAQLAQNAAQSSSLAQSLTNQNLASLGSLSLEAFKQVFQTESKLKIRFIR